MQTFVMLTKLAHATLTSPKMLEQIEQQVMEHVRHACPGVQWLASYAVLGPYDYVDLFQAPDIDTAMKIATIFRTYGHADTETWAATEWQRFKQLNRSFGIAVGAT